MNRPAFEPLVYFYSRYDYNPTLIAELVTGERYTAVLLNNGNIGVCANLQNKFGRENIIPVKINLDLTEHRIIYTAYLNATMNYENNYERELDIFEAVDFSIYQNTVMIGYFMPIVKKFDDAKIKLTVFDFLLEDERLSPHENKEECISKSDCLIVTATSIMNKTLWDLLSNSNSHCDIFLLGPSSIMHDDLFQHANIKKIFGSVFEKNDRRVLQLIKDGYGTRDFLKLGKKVVFEK